jgi:calcineurin-like phosphoesterase family protein
MRFFTSDTHFGHANILRLSNRPFSDIQHHNEMLVKNWNDVVGPDDTVFHLGDVALGTFVDSIEYVRRLNGFKILVPGNHDRISSVEKPSRRERFRPAYEDVFDMIGNEVEMTWIGDTDNGMSVEVSHYPYDGDSHDGDRFTEIRGMDNGIVRIHGHTHQDKIVSHSKNGTLQIHVGVDSHNYTPVSEETIAQIIKENS